MIFQISVLVIQYVFMLESLKVHVNVSKFLKV